MTLPLGLRLHCLVLAIAATGFAAGCSGGNSLAPPEAVVPVETARATIRPITALVTSEGVLYPIHQASISPSITAPVRKYYVQRGNRVHRGELLAVLQNKDLAAAVTSAEGGFDQAKATYAATTSSTLPEEMQTAKLTLQNTQANLNAQQKLYDSEQKLYREGAIARKQLDSSEVTLTAARSAYETAKKHLVNLQSSGATHQRQAAKGQLELAKGQYLSAAAKLSYTEIRSPIDGTVADRAVYPGDIAPAGTPLIVVMDTSKVVVRLHIPELQAAQIKMDDAAYLEVSGLLKSFPAKVTVISPALDPNSTTVEVWVEADNPKGDLKPGASVQVSIVTRTASDALVIPESAILTASDGAKSVMIVGDDSRAHSRPVKTGIQQGPFVQILSGITPGEIVIVNGAYGLPDKTKVKATLAAETSNSEAPGP